MEKLKSILGKLAFWIEAIFGLYHYPERLGDDWGKNKEDFLKEIYVMYTLMSVMNKKSLIILFYDRARFDIWSLVKYLTGNRNIEIPELPKIREYIGKYIGIEISQINYDEISYTDKNGKSEFYKATFSKIPEKDEEYKLFLILEFLTDQATMK